MHYKYNNKEIKTYVQGLRPFGNTLPRGVKGILRKNGYNFSEIISKWNFLVGKEIADCCVPKSIKMSKGNKSGNLVLFVKRGDEINVEFSKKKIVDKINSYFGYKLIDQVKLQTYNSDRKNEKKDNILKKSSGLFENKINEIKNKDIRNSLFKFLDAVKND